MLCSAPRREISLRTDLCKQPLGCFPNSCPPKQWFPVGFPLKAISMSFVLRQTHLGSELSVLVLLSELVSQIRQAALATELNFQLCKWCYFPNPTNKSSVACRKLQFLLGAFCFKGFPEMSSWVPLKPQKQDRTGVNSLNQEPPAKAPPPNARARALRLDSALHPRQGRVPCSGLWQQTHGLLQLALGSGEARPFCFVNAAAWISASH